jgi:branched-chain amino acid transport system ATP-binding protein
MKPKKVLELKQLVVAYGSIKAVKGVNLDIHQGELVSLIGSNGAGKTTTLKAIAGLIAPQSGTITLNQMISSGISHELVQKGLALVPEGRGIFTRMTVLENLQMGAYLRKDEYIGQDLEKIFEYFPRLRERLNQLAGTLSGGEQQMLAISRALMSKPAILLLDEPTMGLSPIMVDIIFEVIQKVSKEGMSILLVEQNAKIALSICHRAYVMESGEITIEGLGEDLLKDPRINEAYLGA